MGVVKNTKAWSVQRAYTLVMDIGHGDKHLACQSERALWYILLPTGLNQSLL